MFAALEGDESPEIAVFSENVPIDSKVNKINFQPTTDNLQYQI